MVSVCLGRYIITELVEGGELFDRICDLGSFSEKDAAGILKQILDALVFLHANGIVHRDIKPGMLPNRMRCLGVGFSRRVYESSPVFATLGVLLGSRGLTLVVFNCFFPRKHIDW